MGLQQVEVKGFTFEIDTMDWNNAHNKERDKAENDLVLWLKKQPAEYVSDLHAALLLAKEETNINTNLTLRKMRDATELILKKIFKKWYSNTAIGIQLEFTGSLLIAPQRRPELKGRGRR